MCWWDRENFCASCIACLLRFVPLSVCLCWWVLENICVWHVLLFVKLHVCVCQLTFSFHSFIFALLIPSFLFSFSLFSFFLVLSRSVSSPHPSSCLSSLFLQEEWLLFTLKSERHQEERSYKVHTLWIGAQDMREMGNGQRRCHWCWAEKGSVRDADEDCQSLRGTRPKRVNRQ